MITPPEGHVSVRMEDGVARVEFSHPKANSLPKELLESLADSIRIAGQDDSCRVVLLSSAGERTFCSGASFDEFETYTTNSTGQIALKATLQSSSSSLQ